MADVCVVPKTGTSRNADDAGLFKIDLTVDRAEDVGRYRVLLLSRPTRAVIAETTSDASGAASFEYLTDAHGYIAVAVDYGSNGDSDSADTLTITEMVLPAF